MAGVPTNKIAIRIDRIAGHATRLAAMAAVESNDFFTIDDAIVRAQEIKFHAEKLIEDINEWLNEEVK